MRVRSKQSPARGPVRPIRTPRGLAMAFMAGLLLLAPITCDRAPTRSVGQPENGLTLGSVLMRETDFGTYFLYTPETHTAASELVVVVHGTPSSAGAALPLARQFIDRWVDLADRRGAVIIAPVFDRANFGSVDADGAYGGYRGLYGRVVGADEFVHVIIDSVMAAVGLADDRFHLYGHSAGGQFANRYLVRHPDRIHGAVISAAGRYAFPDPDAPWHYGMGQVQRTLTWPGTDDEQLIDITPAADGWGEAATLPVTVVLGDQDTEPQPERPGQMGTTRIEIGLNWVQAMNDLAAATGRVGNVRFVIVSGVGHDSAGLTAASQEAMFGSE